MIHFFKRIKWKTEVISRLPFFRVLFLILLRPLTLAGPKVCFAGKFCSINKKHYLCSVKINHNQ